MPIAILLLNMLPGLLSTIPGISAGIKQIISDVSGGASAVLASGVVEGPKEKLAAVAQLELAVQAALVADHTASLAVDWSKIVVIATV